MNRWKTAPVILACALLCLAGLRELGVVDASFYKSNLTDSQTATKTQTIPGSVTNISYQVTLKYKNQTLHQHTQSYDNSPPVEIEATLEEPVFSGNCILPLSKDFKMTYRCPFTTVKSPNGADVHGHIEGEVTAGIHGLCSSRKARELAREEAKKQIVSYFQNQLNL